MLLWFLFKKYFWLHGFGFHQKSCCDFQETLFKYYYLVFQKLSNKQLTKFLLKDSQHLHLQSRGLGFVSQRPPAIFFPHYCFRNQDSCVSFAGNPTIWQFWHHHEAIAFHKKIPNSGSKWASLLTSQNLVLI